MVGRSDTFIEESRKMIGKEAEVPQPVNTQVTLRAIRLFSVSLGSRNPLWNDPYYATFSRYGCLVAPQTFLAAVRCPASDGAYSLEDYGLAKFFTSADFEWFDKVKCGDAFTTELKLKDVFEKVVEKKQTIQLVSDALYWNQHKELVGKCQGTITTIPIKRGEEMLVDRGIYVYSDKDVATISKDLDSESSRESATVYWEEVKEGDKLTPVVKGPVGLSDIMSWRQIAYNVDYALEIIYHRALKETGNRRINPTTNWPYWHEDQDWDDYFSCKASGMPLPWVHGLHRVCLAEDLLTKWMSDDGFLRRLSMEVLKPFFYQDTNWYRGEVVEKYKEKIGDTTYKAVNVKIEVTNQLGEKSASGDATIYLPSRGQEVKLPIPR
jgi:acyl dehydratase